MGKHCRKKKTWHHLNPRSRAPELLAKITNPTHDFIRKIYRKKLIDARKHAGWHLLFSNMFAWEVVEQIKLWANEAQDGFKIALSLKQRHAWQMVFGANISPKKAIEIIKRGWWPEYPPFSDFSP